MLAEIKRRLEAEGKSTSQIKQAQKTQHGLRDGAVRPPPCREGRRGTDIAATKERASDCTTQARSRYSGVVLEPLVGIIVVGPIAETGSSTGCASRQRKWPDIGPSIAAAPLRCSGVPMMPRPPDPYSPFWKMAMSM